MRLTVRAPATVANLGPGFDSFGLAVDLFNEATADTEAPPGVTVVGEGAGELPTDASNLVFRSMAFLAQQFGRALPPFGLSCANGIPLERGLGASAAAVAAGLLLADALLDLSLPPDRLLELAVDAEGHPDNAAAVLRGGVTLAYLTRDGWRAESLTPSPDLRPVLLVPEHERMPTVDARRALPRQVELRDAAFNAGRSALLVLALTARPDLLAAALDDRLHQPARLPLVPATRALFYDLKEAGIPVCLAGAGPSLLAFEVEGRAFPELGPGWRVLRVRPEPRGARLTVSSEASPGLLPHFKMSS